VTTWCVDANVIIATLLDEKSSSNAQAFWSELRPTDDVVSAQVLHPECVTVLRRKVAEGVISSAEGRTKINQLFALPIVVETSPRQFRLAFEWALAQRRLKMHDLQYVAVGLIRNAHVVTLDGGVRQIAVERGVPVTVIR
jgi:predicted nucleic acid-binding protein